MDRFVQFAHMRQRDSDGKFTAVVWDRDLEVASKAQAMTRPKARRLAVLEATSRAEAAAAPLRALLPTDTKESSDDR